MTKARAPELRLTRTAAIAVHRGHPWVYREGLDRPPTSLESGCVVDLCDDSGAFRARGLWDATSPIAVRIFSKDRQLKLDVGAIAASFERALALRDALFPKRATENATTAFRLCHGEGDRIPGLVVDKYEHVAIVRTDGEAMAAWLDRLVDPLWSLLAPRGIETLGVRIDRDETTGSRVRLLRGRPLPERVTVRECGVVLEVDIARGQKTGAFLDQRENRARVRSLAATSSRALNLFSYAGGFSIAAALAGVSHVTSVDSAAPAHAAAQHTFRANGLDPTAHAFVTADVFEFLERARSRGERFDFVISDPPNFAPSEKTRARAVTTYRKLHAAIAKVLDAGGIFCAASCSSHVTVDDFVSTLDDATLGRNDLRVTGVYGQPADHPTIASWPEGRYLKFAVLR